MLKYSKQISQSEEVVMAPATAQLVQLTISSEIAKRQNIPVPDMTPAAQVDYYSACSLLFGSDRCTTNVDIIR